jgi:hypothetical protein
LLYLDFANRRKSFRRELKVDTMQIPEWLKPAVIGGLCGAALMSFIGFNQLGWESASSADRLARDRAEGAVVTALVPQCVAKARATSQAEALTKFQSEASSYSRNDIVATAGWATLGEAKFPDNLLARACAAQLYVAKAG